MKFVPLLFLLPFFASPPIPYRQLSWSDFKGKVPASSQGDACTCTNISIGTDTAFAVFLPDRSWTKTNDKALLRHEQLHFAITKYYASQIAFLLTARCDCSYDIGKAVSDWREKERRYDLETDHGRNEAEQKRWEEMIKL